MNRTQLAILALQLEDHPDLLNILDEREQNIIKLRIGPPSLTLAAVAAKFGITRERVRQIEDRAGQKVNASQN